MINHEIALFIQTLNKYISSIELNVNCKFNLKLLMS